jgi:hypothetical protein
MIRGFYDQLGVDSDAPPETIQESYHRLVVELRRRLDVVKERGGDTERLELARHQADEAYAVLSDPRRRRRYDALLAVSSDGIPASEDAFWATVAGATVPAEVAAAVDLIRAATALRVEVPPAAPAPRRPASPVPQPLGTVVPLRANTTAPTASPATTQTPVPAPPNLRVVDGAASAAPVIVMPTLGKPAIVPSPPSDGPEAMLARFGPTGEMLRKVREHQGLSLQDVAEQTRIAVRFLEAVEQEGFDRLPSATFVRGYVRQYAGVLGLDEDDVVDGYMERFHEGR